MSTAAPPAATQVLTTECCDACGVSEAGESDYLTRARVLVVLLSGKLYFCGSHFTANENVLRRLAIDIIDERGLT